MNNKDFMKGYVVGYNDGVSESGGGNTRLNSFPVTNQKFKIGNSDFSILFGDINTGFYDALNDIGIDYNTKEYDTKGGARWSRPFWIILCKNNVRFGAFQTGGDTAIIFNRKHILSDTTFRYETTTDYLDTITIEKKSPSSPTGEWIYRAVCKCHYITTYSDGTPPDKPYEREYVTSFYKGLYFNSDGSIHDKPTGFADRTDTFTCENTEWFKELMNIMLTLPDIKEE